MAARATAARGGGEKAAATYAATGEQWLSYLTTVIQPKFPQGIPLATMQEMRTLAGSLEHLSKGEVGKLGDVLTQRLKALELGLSGHEAAAQAVQLITLQQQRSTGAKELEMAQDYEKRMLKLKKQARDLA